MYLDQFGAFALAFNGVYQSPPLNVGDQILLPGGFITVTLTANNILQVYSFNGIITTITSGPLGGITSLSLQVLVPTRVLYEGYLTGIDQLPVFSGLFFVTAAWCLFEPGCECFVLCV